MLAAADTIHSPFAVINADDFYGSQSFRLLAQQLSSGSSDCALVAFRLRNTLSTFGAVSRGICELDSSGCLGTIVERTCIAPDGQHARNTEPNGHVTRLTGDELVSMNMWGFTPAIFPKLHIWFARFLTQHPNDLTAEAFLPNFVNDFVTSVRARVRVLETPEPWFGITYREDLPRVASSIRALITAGHYPERLP